MTLTTKLFPLLALALMVGISTEVRAEEQEGFPVQAQIEARQIHAMHSLRCMNSCDMAKKDVKEEVATVEETIAPPVLFATGSNQLTAKDMIAVKKVAALLKTPAFANRHVMVNGYTDNKGKSAANKRLSFHRAAKVVQELIKLGVPAKQLTARGFGPENPVANNATASGRAENRRVTFTAMAVQK